MKTIRVIDLLYKATKKEECPEMIMYEGNTYIKNERNGYYYYYDIKYGLDFFNVLCSDDLVEEAEIIEENNENISEELKNIEKAFNDFYGKAEEFINKMKEN